MGSEPTAAGGGRKEASEWPRSVCNAAAPSARRTPGTATGILAPISPTQVFWTSNARPYGCIPVLLCKDSVRGSIDRFRRGRVPRPKNVRSSIGLVGWETHPLRCICEVVRFHRHQNKIATSCRRDVVGAIPYDFLSLRVACGVAIPNLPLPLGEVSPQVTERVKYAEPNNIRPRRGERWERRLWRKKRPERVAAVGGGRRHIAEDIRRAPQQGCLCCYPQNMEIISLPKWQGLFHRIV